MQKKKIVIIAGEASGDILGAKLMEELARLGSFEFSGVGGELMKTKGFRTIFPMEELSLMGLFEVLPNIPNLLSRIRQTVNYILEQKPAAVITIDSPDFCFRVIKKIKDKSIKKIHLIAPSVWAYRKNRAKKVAALYDLLLCILPFEPPYFEKYGLRSRFIGHPIFDGSKQENNLNKKKLIILTPGSRKSEIKQLLPIMLEASIILKKEYRDYNFVIFSTENTDGLIEKELQTRKLDFIALEKDVDNKKKYLSNATFAIAKSGTNTFELAMNSIAFVVVYKFNTFTSFLASQLKRFSSFRFANLINIINNKEVVPELLLQNCTVANIVATTRKYLDNEKLREEQIKINCETIKQLGFATAESAAARAGIEITGLING